MLPILATIRARRRLGTCCALCGTRASTRTEAPRSGSVPTPCQCLSGGLPLFLERLIICRNFPLCIQRNLTASHHTVLWNDFAAVGATLMSTAYRSRIWGPSCLSIRMEASDRPLFSSHAGRISRLTQGLRSDTNCALPTQVR